MRAQESWDDSPGPLFRRGTHRLQRLEFRFQTESVAGLRLNRGSAVFRQVAQGVQYFFGQRGLAGLAHSVDARPNAPASFSDFFVACTRNAFLEIDQARFHEHRVSVRIDEAG